MPKLAQHLFHEPFAFNFFQAVRLLERLYPMRSPVGRTARPEQEVVRFLAHVDLMFPPSQISKLELAPEAAVPAMTVAFIGLTGPQGALPRHYTELLMSLQMGRLPEHFTKAKGGLARDASVKGAERTALRDWLDLFNHRLISLFFRAWEKYRFFIPFERGEYSKKDADPFTRCLLSLVGLEASPTRRLFAREEISPLRHRLHVSYWYEKEGAQRAHELGRVDDLALLYYSGFLAQRRRNAIALEVLLSDYFQLPITIKQFHGQWLYIERANQSQMPQAGESGNNMELGVNAMAGEKVWDVQSKFRVRIGPLRYAAFLDLLPDRALVPERKTFFLLCHLVRFYVGPGLDFDVQLVLKAEDVPSCQVDGHGIPGPRLGWNTWVQSRTPEHDVEDVAFESVSDENSVWLNGPPPSALI